MELPRELAQMDAEKLRDLAAALISRLAERDERLSQQDVQIVARDAAISARDAELSVREAQLASRDQELKHKQLKIDQLTHEMATLKRWQYGRRSEQLDAVQRSLLDESIDADIEAISVEIEALRAQPSKKAKSQPKRAALPAEFPRRIVPHEPENTHCGCGCDLERIGEDVSEKLDYTPGVFTVEQHVRGKWVCRSCERLIQAPVPPQVIDKGIPTAGLLAQVLIAKYAQCRYRHWAYHAALRTMR